MSGINSPNCYHCGDSCENERILFNEKNFCCNGCKTIYEILNQNDLTDYYTIENTPGVKNRMVGESFYKFLDIDEIADELFEFKEGDRRVVRLFLPEIHFGRAPPWRRFHQTLPDLSNSASFQPSVLWARFCGGDQ